MGLVTEMRLPSAGVHETHVFSYTGKHRYSVTLFTHGSKEVFRNAEPVRAVLEVLGECGRKEAFEITAYCFLPGRLVIIIGGKDEGSDFRSFIRGFRTESSSRVQAIVPGELWSRRYQERVVRRGENLRAVVRDLFLLPVRGGLAQAPTAYPYQGSFTGLTPAVTSPRGRRTHRREGRHPEKLRRGPRGGGRRARPKPGP